jgi:phage terminase small subunit
MARQRSDKRDKAYEIYKKHNGDVKLKDIAKEIGVTDIQVRKWKNQDEWEQKLKGTLPMNSNVTNQSVLNKIEDKEEFLPEEVKEIIKSDLTDKQRLFCDYYIKYRNKTKAYMKAYQCSYENACSHAYEMWKNVGVKNEIDRRLKELRDELKLDAQDLIQKYIDIAFADITDYLTFGQREIIRINEETGEEETFKFNYVDFNNSCEVDGTIVSEVKQGKDGVSIKLQDKMKAMDWLTNHMNLLDTATKEKLKLENEKLGLAKLKADKNNEDDKPIQIVISRKGEGK